MIVLDTSALMSILLDEPETEIVTEVLDTDEPLTISAGTLVETLIVAERRGLAEAMRILIEGLEVEVDPTTGPAAHRIAEAYTRWGKGIHPAELNFGDCFAYELAMRLDAPLLYVGDDFSRTDVRQAIPTDRGSAEV